MRFNLFVLLVFTCTTCFAQQPFPTSANNPSWRTVEDYFWDPGVTHNTWTLSADTVFCGETYHIAEAPTNNWISGYYKAYVRNQGDQVFYRLTNNCADQEYLLYDYNLTVGDTFWLPRELGGVPFNTDSTAMVVQQVDSLTVFGITRKRISLTSTGNTYPMEWLYGVGDMSHPFYALLFRGTEEDFVNLCMDSLGTQVYQHPNYSACTVIISVPEPIAAQLNVYPNPSRNGWQIQATDGQAIDQIEVFDLQGKRVYFQTTRQTGFSHDQWQIPAQTLPGIYLLRAQINGQPWQGKLIQTR